MYRPREIEEQDWITNRLNCGSLTETRGTKRVCTDMNCLPFIAIYNIISVWIESKALF